MNSIKYQQLHEACRAACKLLKLRSYNNNNNNQYGPTNDKGTKFLQELGRRLRTIRDDPHESAFLRQRISITLQRFNAIASSDTFTSASETEFEA